jgi:hypothetical protein
MVSKNNRKFRMQQQAKRRPHYGLRKLTIGVASVLLSTTFYFGMGAVNAQASQLADNDQKMDSNSTALVDATQSEMRGQVIALQNSAASSTEQTNLTSSATAKTSVASSAVDQQSA